MSNLDTAYRHVLARLKEDAKIKKKLMPPGQASSEHDAAKAWLDILYKAAQPQEQAKQPSLGEL